MMHQPDHDRKLPTITAAELLRAYDDDLRTEAEVVGAASVTREGPLWIAVYSSGRGFVTYRDLGNADSCEIARLVAFAREYFERDTRVQKAEWKTRGHDAAPGLHEALVANGFVPDEPESVMVGRAEGLAGEVPLPAGVTLRNIRSEADVRAMCDLQDRVFGDVASEDWTTELIERAASDDAFQLWVAEANGEMVSSGRLEPIPGTAFAGLWGGGTLSEWRGKGIYRALTAARARAALSLGRTLLHSDSTEFSRPILERSGMVKVTTTTPYIWRR
ncbi:MAG: hypothetical protein KF813_10810 [Trueperaceae bacterium]|nr:hypothetical protein [Trueperaceae bacterium]